MHRICSSWTRASNHSFQIVPAAVKLAIKVAATAQNEGGEQQSATPTAHPQHVHQTGQGEQQGRDSSRKLDIFANGHV